MAWRQPGKGEQAFAGFLQAIGDGAMLEPPLHPRHLQAYEDTCAGSADLVINMAETAQERREARRDKALDHEFSDRRLRMFLAFFALAILLVAGTVIWFARNSVLNLVSESTDKGRVYRIKDGKVSRPLRIA